jgi:hypothetical protein
MLELHYKFVSLPPEIFMKSVFNFFLVLLTLALSGCLASTTSPVGVACDYRQNMLLWQMPLVCQGR